MRDRFKQLFLSLFLFVLVLGGGFGVVGNAQAQDDTDPFGLEEIGTDAGFTDASLTSVIGNLINYALGFLGVIAVAITLWGGFQWMTAGGNAEKVERAKRTLLQGLIGIAIILMSWLIVTFVFDALNQVGLFGDGGEAEDGEITYGGPDVVGFVVQDFIPEGFVPNRNVQYQVTFSRVLDPESVDGNFSIVNQSSGQVVPGTAEANGNKITFVPDAACPEPNEDRNCFDEFTVFDVEVLDGLQDTTGRDLDCTVRSCTSSFETGDLIDIEGPQVDFEIPENGERLQTDTLIELLSHATDDTGVAVADFTVDDDFIDSVAAQGDDLRDVLIQTFWPHDSEVYPIGDIYRLNVTVTDFAGNEDTDFVIIRINPAHCYNGFQDEDETDIDCGGSCGVCSGGQCTEDIDCAQGRCQDGLCVNVPKIDGVSPNSGAEGSLVTISGEFFGTRTGAVYFSDGAGGLIEATFGACGIQWDQDEVTIEVPVGAVDGPIILETSGGLQDATNDGYGRPIPDFDVNDIARPGICFLSPRVGSSGEQVRVNGFGYGDERASSQVFFGDEEVRTYVAWEEERVDVQVPAQDEDEYETYIVVDGVESNRVSFFQVPFGGGGDAESQGPTVAFTDPESGGIGQYVTVHGSNFGNTIGTVSFENQATGDIATGSTNFPQVCSDQFWKDDQITIIVPATYDNGDPIQAAAHDLFVTSAVPTDPPSNRVTFPITTADPTPGICAVTPDIGEHPTSVTLHGAGFDTDGDVLFYDSVNAQDVIDWRDGEVSVVIPEPAQTGPVRLRTNEGDLSNSVNFEVGQQIEVQSESTPEAAYAWTFSTGEIPQTPQLITECSDTRVSAVPNTQFSQDVCVNADVYAEFDMVMDHGTFVEGQSVLVESCLDETCDQRAAVSGNIHLSDNAEFTSMTWRGNQNFDPSTTYQVTVTTDVTNDSLPPIGLLRNVVWQFTTQASDQDCVVQSVRVSPHEELLRGLNEESEFLGLPSAQDNCVVLNASDYTWTWGVDNSIASILEGACSDFAGDDSCAVVRALAEGESPVTAQENFSGEIGEAQLTIDFTDPRIIDHWPDCNVACIDASVGARFNVGMDPAIEQLGMLTGFECENELCLTFAGEFAREVRCINGPDGCTEIVADYDGSLRPDTYYKVVISGNVRSEDGVPLGEDYSWIFSTKSDEAVCTISRVQLTPEDPVVEAMGAYQEFNVIAFGEADECSAAGQRLNAFNYDWDWEDPIVDDPLIAEWFKHRGDLLDTDPDSIRNGCTASCLASGSEAVPAICGDGVIEGAEECDDSNIASGDGCSSICLREGDNTVGVCGDGVLDQNANGAGEDCDDGGLVDGDGCSSTCLNEGSDAVGAVCGNEDVGYTPESGGEDCDDGNTLSGDGCSSECLFEGSISQIDVRAVCGNNIVETPFESCDDGELVNGDGCSDRCLREGIDPTDSSECGNGIWEYHPVTKAGEDCDDGNTISGDGCSANCLAEGSSLTYDIPSVCGDNLLGTGELVNPQTGRAICELGADPDGDIDPNQVSVIVDTAASQVDLETNTASTTIRVEESSTNVGTETTLNLICSAETALDCPDAQEYGVNTASCCMQRPEATLFPNGLATCRNAAVYGEFTQEMDLSTFPDNVYLELDTTTTGGLCPEGHQVVGQDFAFVPQSGFVGRLLNTLLSMVVGVARAQQDGACIMPISSFDQSGIDADTYKVNFRYGNLLAENARYQIVVDGDDDVLDEFLSGVLNTLGVALFEGEDQIFETTTEVCSLDSVDVRDTDADSPALFTQAGEVHPFVATPYSYAGGGIQEIEEMPGVYEWDWLAWEEDSDGTVVDFSAMVDDTSDVEAQFESGDADVVAQAEITTDTIFDTVGDVTAGSLNVEAIICTNPWPALNIFPFIDDETGQVPGTTEGSGWMNFSTWYCKDSGLEDVTVIAPAESARGTDVIKEYLFPVADGSGDAIGFRVTSNEDYLNPLNWYQAQGFAGSPTELSIEGLEAIQDGRTAYISAPNVDDQNGVIYSNIYVFSYNEGASESTIQIFDQMIENLQLMTNVEEVGLCHDGAAYTSDTCRSDQDCNVGAGHFCGDDKSKLIRDNKRLTDLTDLSQKLQLYSAANGRCSGTTSQTCSDSVDCPLGEVCRPAFPTLDSGTFVRGLDSSRWESWVNTLQDELQIDLPTDPLNNYLGCGASPYEAYDADTCVDQTNGSYLCPLDSHVYHYRPLGPFAYNLGAELEYGSAAWVNPIDQDSTDEKNLTVGRNGSDLPPPQQQLANTGFTYAPAYCNGLTQWGNSSTCGDGVVGLDQFGTPEVCEIGQEGNPVPCDTDPNVDSDQDGDPTNDGDGTQSQICNASCSGYEENPGAACVPATCGNGILDGAEECDDGPFNGQYGFCGHDCRNDSRFYCGDGTVAGAEACDCSATPPASGRTFGGNVCSDLNGSYHTNPNLSCAWDCAGPAPHCGDGEIQAGEVCDGNTNVYEGKLCGNGPNVAEPCEVDADCGQGFVCGGAPKYEACPVTTVCIAGNVDKLGAACGANTDCDSNPGEGDGACSTQTFQTTRTQVCADDGANGDLCTWAQDLSAIECLAPLNCGNGVVDEGEQCDDGNEDNTDGCTNECLANVCGDGFLHAGVEDCDEGADNGVLCEANYGEPCTYCSDSCRLLTATGAFCGDGQINGDEFCDAGDLPYYFASIEGTIGNTCDPDDVGTSYVENNETFFCTNLGVCEGGSNHGQLCNIIGEDPNFTVCAGRCIYPECRNSCVSSCPQAYDAETLVFQGNLVDSPRESSIVLQDKEAGDNADVLTVASSATVFIPECRAYQSMELLVNDDQRIYPDVEIMFLLDVSDSMFNNQYQNRTRIDWLREAVLEAAVGLEDAYAEIGEPNKLKVGLGFIGGRHGENDDGQGSDCVTEPCNQPDQGNEGEPDLGDPDIDDPDDPCDGVTCSEGETCVEGQCVDIELTCDPPCGQGFICVGTQCIEENLGFSFTAGADVTMLDGSTKDIETVQVGDMAIGYDILDQRKEAATVVATFDHEVDGFYRLNEGLLEVTDTHPVYTKKQNGSVGWAAIDAKEGLELEVGDEVFSEDESWIPVTSIEFVPGTTHVFNLQTESAVGTFYVNGVLVKNTTYALDGTRQQAPTSSWSWKSLIRPLLTMVSGGMNVWVSEFGEAPLAIAAYQTFYGQNHFITRVPQVGAIDIALNDAVYHNEQDHAGTPVYGSVRAAESAFSGTADQEYIVIFTDGQIANRHDLGNRENEDPAGYDYLNWGYLENPPDFGGDNDIDQQEYSVAVSQITDRLKNSGMKIFMAVYTDAGDPLGTCMENQMARWSSEICTAQAFGCIGNESEGNYLCEPGEDGIQYAYSSNSPEEFNDMFESIVDAIVNYTVNVTFDGEAVATQLEPGGGSKTVDLPPGFRCDLDEEQQLTMHLSFDGGGSIEIENSSFNMCPD